MAFHAGRLGGLERACHPVGGELLDAVAHLGHMAIDAGDARVGVDAGGPSLVVRVLGFQHLRARIGMIPILLETFCQPGGVILELAGDAESLGNEIGSVREKLEDAQREAGLALEGTDRADVLIGECQQIIAGVRRRGAKDETAH